jgi:hypothetical protein
LLPTLDIGSHINANDDILSVDDDGSDLWIEVKATTGRDGRFEWSRQNLNWRGASTSTT